MAPDWPACLLFFLSPPPMRAVNGGNLKALSGLWQRAAERDLRRLVVQGASSTTLLNQVAVSFSLSF